MAYRWSLEGPAFEFPTPYGTENRFLKLRGYALLVLALLVLVVLSVVEAPEAPPSLGLLDTVPEPASVVPHVFMALVLAAFGALDLLQAAGQRGLLLAPGQPASLLPEVAREGSGAGRGAAALQRLLEIGEFKPPPLAGPYQAGLAWAGDDIAAAPTTLHNWLRQRLSHAALALALLLWVLLAVLLVRKPAALALVTLVPALLCAAVLGRHLVQPDKPARQPGLLVAAVVVGLMLAAAAGWYAELLPRADVLPRLGLPLAAAVLLLGVVLTEGLGVLVARSQLQPALLNAVPAESTHTRFEAEPEQLLREVDLELHRQWTEGIPNRRYAWLPPQLERGADEGPYTASVLEESQPLVVHGDRSLAPAAVPQGAARVRALVTLNVLGLLLSLTGGLLWLALAALHMKNPAATWVPAAAGLAALLGGYYAMRVAHLPWSRVEVQSTLTWLDFKGRYQGLPAAPADAAARARGASPVRVDDLQLDVRVGELRSLFYAAAPHDIGSRVMLQLQPGRNGLAPWQKLLDDFTRGAAPTAAAAAPPRPRDVREVREAEVTPARRPARFCAHCGTPVLAGARFCQHCGSTLAAD